MSDDQDYQREIAKVESTHFGFEDHGVLTAYMHVNYGGMTQSVGGYFLGPNNGPACAEFMSRILRAFGVNTWEAVRGRTVYVLRDANTRRVEGIEPLPTERGERFIFVDAFAGGAS